LIATVALRIITAKLDASVGASGPHDFAVRSSHHSSNDAIGVHRILPPTFRDDWPYVPPGGSRMRGYNHKFLKNGSKIFLRRGLDRPNQLEPPGEIEFLARSVSVLFGRLKPEAQSEMPSSFLKMDN
jgi:hypothetical protein